MMQILWNIIILGIAGATLSQVSVSTVLVYMQLQASFWLSWVPLSGAQHSQFVQEHVGCKFWGHGDMIRTAFLYCKTLMRFLVKAGAPLVYRSSSTDQTVLIKQYWASSADQAVSRHRQMSQSALGVQWPAYLGCTLQTWTSKLGLFSASWSCNKNRSCSYFWFHSITSVPASRHAMHILACLTNMDLIQSMCQIANGSTGSYSSPDLIQAATPACP